MFVVWCKSKQIFMNSEDNNDKVEDDDNANEEQTDLKA